MQKGKARMFDELERLRQTKELYELLEYYQQASGPDRQAWLDRVIEWQELAPRDLVRLHGELIAYGWLDQNTGITPLPRLGAALAAYRITTGGIRALRQAREEVPV
jgi:hypothetical protein